MKGKIIGIVFCSIGIIAIIALLICNWTGAFAQGAKTNTERAITNNGIMFSKFLPSLYYTHGGDSTTPPWLWQPRLRDISFMPYKNDVNGWGIQIVIQNAYDPTIPNNSYTLNWDLDGLLIQGTEIGAGYYWVYNGYPGYHANDSLIISSASNVPNQDIALLEAWLNKAENLAIYYIDYHYTGNSIKLDICFVDIKLDTDGYPDVSDTQVFSIYLSFGGTATNTNPTTYLTLSGESGASSGNEIKIKPWLTVNFPTTTPAYYNNNAYWNPSVVFREINPEIDFYTQQLITGKDYNEGYNEGYIIGKTEGYEQGKTDGIEQGIASATPIQSATSIVKAVFSALDVKLFGVISVLDLVGIVVVLGLVFLVIKLIR